MNIPTQQELLTLTRAARDTRRAKALRRLMELAKDPDNDRILKEIWERMRASANSGGSCCDLPVQEVFGKADERPQLRSEVWSLLQDLGYDMDCSCSSNYYNEQWFVRWGPEEES